MIIVFTLIMLTVFLTTALSFSYFIISDINKAKAIDNSIIAYYSADAGMEESLFLLKNQELAGSVDSLKSKRPDPIDMVLSKGVWDISSSTSFETSVLRQRLHNGQSAKFFILNRDSTNQTKSITLEWYKGIDTTAKLQVNLTQLAHQYQSSTLIYYLDTSILEVADTIGKGSVACYNLKDLDLDGIALDSPSDYLAEFLVLGSSVDFVDTLDVKAYSIACDSNPDTMAAAYNPQGITNPTVKSTGTYGRSTQSIIAHILPKDPVSGMLGFVLFSEQDVTKE